MLTCGRSRSLACVIPTWPACSPSRSTAIAHQVVSARSSLTDRAHLKAARRRLPALGRPLQVRLEPEPGGGGQRDRVVGHRDADVEAHVRVTGKAQGRGLARSPIGSEPYPSVQAGPRGADIEGDVTRRILSTALVSAAAVTALLGIPANADDPRLRPRLPSPAAVVDGSDGRHARSEARPPPPDPPAHAPVEEQQATPAPTETATETPAATEPPYESPVAETIETPAPTARPRPPLLRPRPPPRPPTATATETPQEEEARPSPTPTARARRTVRPASAPRVRPRLRPRPQL